MADPPTVKRALHALAYSEHVDDTDQPERTVADSRTVITTAAESLSAVDDAAAFCERFGLEGLRTATRRAAARGDDDLATRGRATLETLTTYRRVAAGDNDVTAVGDTGSADAADDHFHHARGTPLPRAGQRGDR